MPINKKNDMSKFTRGFTIIELLVVIVIIGILATITVVSYNGLTRKASTVVLQSDLDNAAAQLTLDKITGGAYPATKEAANGGDGLKASTGVSFDYHAANKVYCLEAYNGDGVYYHITSANSVPAEGKCGAATFISGLLGACSEEDCLDLRGTSISETDDGGYASTGYIVVPGTSIAVGSLYIAKYDAVGNLSWGRSWGDAYNVGGYPNGDGGNVIIQDRDGNLIITGSTYSYSSGEDSDMFIVKFDSNGSLIWNKTWGRAGNDNGDSIITTSDNGYVVSGSTCEYRFNNCLQFIAKFDSSGNLLWNKTGGGTSIVQTSDDGYMAIKDEYISKLDSNGDLTWIKKWGTIGDVGNSIIRTSDDCYSIVGETLSYSWGGGADVIFIKFDLSGNPLWSKTWGEGSEDIGNSLIQSSDGGYTIAGNSSSSSPLYINDPFILKLDSEGVVSWNNILVGDHLYLNEGNRSIVQSNDGGYAVVGSMPSYSSPVLIKYDEGGNITGCDQALCQAADMTENIPELSISSTTAASPTLTATTMNVSTTSVELPVTSYSIINTNFSK